MTQIKTRWRALRNNARSRTVEDRSMNTELISQTWQLLGDGRAQFVEDFYARFFERFPGYRKLFPRKLVPADLEKMLFSAARFADFADDPEYIATRLRKLGAAHKPLALDGHDLGNFKEVFLEVLAPRLGAQWTAAAEEAWNQAFDDVVIPMMRQGIYGRMHH
jgi:hemoglobin-like flavoprotein